MNLKDIIIRLNTDEVREILVIGIDNDEKKRFRAIERRCLRPVTGPIRRTLL